MSTPRHVNIQLTTTTLIKAVLLVVAVIILYQLVHLVLVVLTAIVIAAAIEPATRWLSKHSIARLPATLLVYVLAILIFIGILAFFIPPFIRDLTGFIGTLPNSIQALNPFGYTSGDITALTQTLNGQINLHDVTSNLSAYKISDNLLSSLFAIFGGLFNLAAIIVLSFYLAVQDHGVQNFLKIITPRRYESYVLNVWKRTEHKIGRWMQGQLILAAIIGPTVYIGLTLLGIKYALLLALIAAMFELIPFFGPIMSAVPSVLLGFTDSLPKGLEVILLYIAIQQIEANVVYPLVVKKMVGIPPLVVIIALLAGGQLAGFFGFLLAAPVAVLLMELLGDLEKSKQEVEVPALE